jgi:2-methylisocitrate lyase-like PEP mutase family enzyme
MEQGMPNEEIPMPTVTDKRRTFHDLHKSGCFVIPNPWDIGSARYLQHLGFKALATTSVGFAFWQAHPDHAISRDMTLANLNAVVAAIDLPVNADFEGGFAHDPEGVAESVRLAVETGVAGLSIEDLTGDNARPLYDFDHAVARMRAARQAIDRAGGDTLLVGRSEGFGQAGAPDLDETIRRLKAYAAAGADCLYAPGIKTREQIAAIVTAVAPKPVNVVIGAPIGLTVADVAALGVRRISLGCGLARAAWGGFMRAVKLIVEDGKFDGLAEAASWAELNCLFAEDRKARAKT